MESLRKAFGFSKDRVEKEGDAFDRDLQEDLKRRRREDASRRRAQTAATGD